MLSLLNKDFVPKKLWYHVGENMKDRTLVSNKLITVELRPEMDAVTNITNICYFRYFCYICEAPFPAPFRFSDFLYLPVTNHRIEREKGKGLTNGTNVPKIIIIAKKTNICYFCDCVHFWI